MRVNVDSKALADPRFTRLAARLKINRHEALGRCIPVWMAAYESRSPLMEQGDVDALADLRGFAKAMIEVDLASRSRGKLKLRGVDERIDFLLVQDAKRAKALAEKKRLAGISGDRPGGRALDGKRRSAPSVPGDVPRMGPYSPDPDLAQDHDQTLEGESSPARAIPPSPAPVSTPSGALRDRRTKLHHDAWQYAALKHAELRGAGISADVPWPVMPAGPPMNDMVEVVTTLLAATDTPDYEAASEIIRRRVDVAAAEARRERHLRWFTPSKIWDPKAFFRAIELSPAEARRKAPVAVQESVGQQRWRIVGREDDDTAAIHPSLRGQSA